MALSQTSGKTAAPKIKVSPAAAQKLHHAALVIDSHADTTQLMLDPRFDFAKGATWVHVTLDKAKAGGLDAQFFSVWLDQTYLGPRAVEQTLRLIDGVHDTVERNSGRMALATSTADIQRNAARGKFAALMGIEGGHAINNDLRNLRTFYRLGIRYMTLTWANSNDWADASGDIDDPKVAHHNGLTAFGREVVAEMNRLGMMVDISHVSDKTFYDVMAVAKSPVIASHSSSRALANHARNMTDDQLRAVAKNGGVVMVNFFSMFLDDEFAKAYRAGAHERDASIEQLRAELKDDPVKAYIMGHRRGLELAASVPRPAFKVLIDHFDHIIKVAGVDHVGLGSDFDGVSSMPQEMDSAADLPKITAALLQRGYSPADLKKILGGNLMRVFAANEKVARQLQQQGPPKGKAAVVASVGR